MDDTKDVIPRASPVTKPRPAPEPELAGETRPRSTPGPRSWPHIKRPPTQRDIRVLVVEDDAMVREWIEHALEVTEFRVAGVAANAAEGVELAVRRNPALILVDYRLPDRAGTELVRELRLRGVGSPAVVMTANPERGLNETARDAGAQATVLKTGRVESLLVPLRAVSRGEQAFDGRHPERKSRRGALSPRERAVLSLVAAGKTNPEIALALGISAETVKTLMQRVFRKLGTRRRAEAVSTAHGLGLL
ncbi:MAG TPA: response regulator transcription factor [Gaiellaceae bacterium]|nr:response regulator transcription factor [Gaiellaceae bacterium]